MSDSTTRRQCIDRLMICFLRLRKGIAQRRSADHEALPLAQAEALMTIGHAQHLTMSQLAELLCVTPGAATQLLESLTDQQLVEKSANAEDRRQTELNLTQEGVNHYEHIKQAKQEFFAQILADLSEEELRQLTELMEKVANSVHQHQQRSTT